MRLSLFAIAGIGLIVAASLGVLAAPDEKAPAADKDELRRLMVERYGAASGEMEARSALYNAGRESVEDVCDAIRRYSSAGLEVAKTREYRLTLCEYALEHAQRIEESVRIKFDKGLEPIRAMKLATYTRLDMEIKLHQVRAESGAEKADEADKKADDSDLPAIHKNAGPAVGAAPSRT
jgi:hypothetical protein